MSTTGEFQQAASDHRSSSRLHRLGDLPGQPGPPRCQHPPPGARPGHRRGPRRRRAAARAGHLRDLWAQAGRLLRRPTQGRPRLLLHRHRAARRGPWHPAHAHRRGRHPRRGHASLFGRAGAGKPAGLPRGSPTARRQPRRRARASGDARSSAPAMTPARPNAATGPSTRKTGWSPVA